MTGSSNFKYKQKVLILDTYYFRLRPAPNWLFEIETSGIYLGKNCFPSFGTLSMDSPFYHYQVILARFRSVPVCFDRSRAENCRNFPTKNGSESGAKEHNGTGQFQSGENDLGQF